MAEKDIKLNLSSQQMALTVAALGIAQENATGRARREENPQIRAIHMKVAADYQNLRTYFDGQYSLYLTSHPSIHDAGKSV